MAAVASHGRGLWWQMMVLCSGGQRRVDDDDSEQCGGMLWQGGDMQCGAWQFVVVLLVLWLMVVGQRRQRQFK